MGGRFGRLRGEVLDSALVVNWWVCRCRIFYGPDEMDRWPIYYSW